MNNTCYVGLAYRDASPRFEERRQDHHRLLRLPLLLQSKIKAHRGRKWRVNGSHLFIPPKHAPHIMHEQYFLTFSKGECET
jgi:hypothetical protein